MAWMETLMLLAASAPVPTPWVVEAESPGTRVSRTRGVIDIDSPKGVTLWWRAALPPRVTIRFEAMAVAGGGANDKVSDLNAFWMARNADGSSVLARPRSGAFADYDDLKTYYVGIGGNRNTTTRFRRYVGTPGVRPLLPQHDLSAADAMLVANRWTRITLIADGRRIAVMRDGRPLFALDDATPYVGGHFGLRTTWSHLRIRHLSITRR